MFGRREQNERKATGAIRLSLLIALGLLSGSSRSLAHDPYEITSTITLHSNRTELVIEMEFNAAMLLAGGPRSRGPEPAAALFQSKLPELQRQAAQFFELGQAGKTLIVTGTNVTLGVEDHVTFNLEFPAVQGGLRVNAAGLKTLGDQGPFGTSVTVLDMVNMKVLGQSVLFASSPTAEFAPAARIELARATNQSPPAIANASPASATPRPPDSAPPGAAACCPGRWLLVLGAALGVLVIGWWWRRRAASRRL